MLKYTLCLIRKNNQLLLLNRNKEPNMGLWNGVGGKIEPNESPYEGAIREALEETGISLKELKFSGNAVWKSNRGNSGMYIFMAELKEEEILNTPCRVEEGVLDWKNIDWILNPENKGIVSNMKMYLPKILDGYQNLEHRFLYKDGLMLNYETSILSSEELNSIKSVNSKA